MSSAQKKKNNHFVPKRYLRRFHSNSVREIGLYNIKSGRVVERAPIKTQCSRDYFYTKNPKYEDAFAVAEGTHNMLLNNIVQSSMVPPEGSKERVQLYEAVMFQVGRTSSTVAKSDHMADQFGKAMLRFGLARDGKHHLIEHLPNVRLETTPEYLVHTILHHIKSRPIIDDLECTLLINNTSEDFLTSDHPVALCNGLPTSYHLRVGFACRGLVILYPIGPHAMLFLSDRETYKIAKNKSECGTLIRREDVINLNLAQFANANENLYFSSAEHIKSSLEAFRDDASAIRTGPPPLVEKRLNSGPRRGVLLDMPHEVRRLVLPNTITLRQAVRTGRFKIGSADVRDPERAEFVIAMAN